MERKGKGEGREGEGEGEERNAKKEETEKEPQRDKDQSLESGREEDGERGEIMESKEGSSSISIFLTFLLRWRFQLELKKKSETKSDF